MRIDQGPSLAEIRQSAENGTAVEFCNRNGEGAGTRARRQTRPRDRSCEPGPGRGPHRSHLVCPLPMAFHPLRDWRYCHMEPETRRIG